jgi:hypothetical protein
MQRYALVEYVDADAKVRSIYDDFLRSTASTDVPIWVKSMGANVDLLHAYWERTKGSLIKGSLPLVFKEMLIFVLSVGNGYTSAMRLPLDPQYRPILDAVPL